MFKKQDSNYHIHINSKDRLNKNDQSNVCSFRLADLISLNSKKSVYVCCPYVNLPPSIYNITDEGRLKGKKYNNKLTFVEDSVPSTVPVEMTISIPNGNYNVVNFQSAITTAMTTASASLGFTNVYTSSYDGITGKLTISIVGSPANRTFTYTFYGENEDLKSFLGFSSEYNDVTYVKPVGEAVYSLTCPDVVNFTASIPAVYVRCSQTRVDSGYDTHVGGNSTTGGNSDILQIVPISANGLSQTVYLDYESVGDRNIEVNTIMNNLITFSLTSDDKNLPVYLNNQDWTLDLLVKYSNDVK